jgi:transketolase
VNGTATVRAELVELASRVREHVIAMCARPPGGHLGGALSAADIFCALYFAVLRIDPDDPAWPDRDYFVLSKGHAACGWYATLAERGLLDPAELASYGQDGSRLAEHPTPLVPWADLATGSLGHGLPFGVGLALAARQNRRPSRCYVLLGDGELQEGSVWEAAMAASSLGLANLVAIVDRNQLQITGATERCVALEPLADRWRAFGWTVTTVDGHDPEQLIAALDIDPPDRTGPLAVIANTRKGRGVPFLEGRRDSHFVKAPWLAARLGLS